MMLKIATAHFLIVSILTLILRNFYTVVLTFTKCNI